MSAGTKELSIPPIMKRQTQLLLHLHCLVRKCGRHWRFHLAGMARALQP